MPTVEVTQRTLQHLRHLERLNEEDRRIIERMAEKWAVERRAATRPELPPNVVCIVPKIA